MADEGSILPWAWPSRPTAPSSSWSTLATAAFFDRQGNFQRKFGSEGGEDGQFKRVDSLASDAYGNILVTDFDTNRLQVFNSEGEHLCTRDELGLKAETTKGLAWGADGQLAVARDGGVALGPSSRWSQSEVERG